MECNFDKFSSRICEKGTTACTVVHEKEKYVPSNSNELLNCPFCGGEATTFKWEEWSDCKRSTEIYWGIGCSTSDCYGEQASDLAYFNYPHEAAESWNKRVRRVLPISDWIDIEERSPQVPVDKFGIRVLVATFDSTFAELNNGRGYDVQECGYGTVVSRNGTIQPYFAGCDPTKFYFYEIHSTEGLMPLGDPVTHWMYLPEPPN